MQAPQAKTFEVKKSDIAAYFHKGKKKCPLPRNKLGGGGTDVWRLWVSEGLSKRASKCRNMKIIEICTVEISTGRLLSISTGRLLSFALAKKAHDKSKRRKLGKTHGKYLCTKPVPRQIHCLPSELPPPSAGESPG